MICQQPCHFLSADRRKMRHPPRPSFGQPVGQARPGKEKDVPVEMVAILSENVDNVGVVELLAVGQVNRNGVKIPSEQQLEFRLEPVGPSQVRCPPPQKKNTHLGVLFSQLEVLAVVGDDKYRSPLAHQVRYPWPPLSQQKEPRTTPVNELAKAMNLFLRS